jgi:spore coat protein CotH
MSKRRRLSKKHRQRMILTLVLIGVIALIVVYLNRASIIRHFYINRYFFDAFESAGKDSGKQPQILNFDFSLRDMEYFTSFKERTSFEAGKRQTVDVTFGGSNYTVDLLPFKNYFKKIKLNKKKNTFCVHFPPGGPMQNKVQSFDLFRMKEADFYEQELVYDLGKRLGLYNPKTDYVNIYINYVDYGDYSLKQSFDEIFLEQNHNPDGIIFMVERDANGPYYIRYLYNESRNPLIEEHLERFPELLQARDPNLLIKYFDLNYLARFEALRKLLRIKSNFLLHDNLRYIYNTVNGKIYPILDESNIVNMLSDKKNKYFKFLSKQISLHPIIKQKRKYYLRQLGLKYKEITETAGTIKKRYDGLDGNLFYVLRVNLVNSYFHTQIYRRLKKYGSKTGWTDPSEELMEVEELSQSTSEEETAKKGNRFAAYLDHMLLAPRLLLEEHRQLGLRFDDARRVFILPHGEYTLSKNLIVPIGYRFEIQAGATIYVSSRVSIVSYSPIDILGTKKKPVIIKALDPENPFDVMAVIGNSVRNGKEQSNLSSPDEEINHIHYLDFSGGSRAFLDGVKHSGGLNIYNSHVQIKYSNIHHNSKNSGLVIKNSRVLLEENQFHNNYSDQLSLYFCRGILQGNRFIKGGGDPNGDGVSLKGSQIYFHRNQFEKQPDKGVSVGKQASAIFYDNYFSGNRTAVSARDWGQALLIDNRLDNNINATSAFRRNSALGGGSLYLAQNSLTGNKYLARIDKYSKCFKLQGHQEINKTFTPLFKQGRSDRLFEAFWQLKEDYPYKENRMAAFTIGNTLAYIDEVNKIILVDLPKGSSSRQQIHFQSKLPGTLAYIVPAFYGSGGTFDPEMIDAEIKITSNRYFDFKEFIFGGLLKLQHDYQVDIYELIVTSGGLPLIEIDSRDSSGAYQTIKNEPKISCTVRFLQPPAPETEIDTSFINQYLSARVEGRGQRWDKWKYGITFKKGIAPGGMPKARRWVLESCYIEKSLMRPKITFDLFDQFRDPTWDRIAPQSRFVEVMVNGDYQGVYLLMEHIDRDFLGLEDFDKSETHNALLYRAKNRSANFSRYNDLSTLYKKGYEDLPGSIQPLDKEGDPIRGWSSGFEQRHPNPDKYGEHWQPLKEFARFVALASETDFEHSIFDMMDIERYINFWILTQLVDDSDGLYQNRYLKRQKGRESKWLFVPWDKDGVFGRDYKMDKRSWGVWLRTPLFERCMNVYWFREALKSTWDTLLVKGIISEENIFKMIDDNAAILADAQKRNFRRWPTDPQNSPYPDSNTFQQEIDYMKHWIHNRIHFLYNWMIRIHNPENR